MNIAILLSGCGYKDGSQIEEVVLSYLILDKYNINHIPVAPNKEQYHVYNHHKNEIKKQNINRNILTESARIGRGKIKSIENLNLQHIDGLIIPGGNGIYKNLTSFIEDKENFQIDKGAKELIKNLHTHKKPICTICGSIILIAKSLENTKIKLKLATHRNLFKDVLSNFNVELKNCSADNIIYDKKNNIISTPSFLAGNNLYESMKGIEKMVKTLKANI